MPTVPPFSPSHCLSDWPDCTLEIRCTCGRSSHPAVRLLIERHGDATFAGLARALRCEACGERPAKAYVVAGRHRDTAGAISPDSSVVLRVG